MRPGQGMAALAAAAGLIAAIASHAQNVVTEWSEKCSAAAYVMAGGPGTGGQRVFTMAHVAMFEAVNAIEPRYASYGKPLKAEPGWSKDAAASTAAYTVLTRLVTHPEKLKEYEALQQKVMAVIPEGEAKARGMALGREAGEAIIALRADDGSNASNDWRPVTAPGMYIPTPFPAAINWFKTRPFAMERGDRFRVPPPYSLSSAEWARDYHEVKRMGAKVGSARTEEQSRIAKFWELTGPATYHPLGIHLAKERKLDIVDSARALALMSIATFDASVAIFDAKYTYNFWRPVTAIRNGDIDGNDATERDSTWEPFIPTPQHPEYPCAHCTFQGAAAAALRVLFGDEMPEVKLTSTSAPGVERRFTRLSDYAAEVVEARILDGVHYRASGVAGSAMGRQIGELVATRLMKPMR